MVDQRPGKRRCRHISCTSPPRRGVVLTISCSSRGIIGEQKENITILAENILRPQLDHADLKGYRSKARVLAPSPIYSLAFLYLAPVLNRWFRLG